MIALNLVIQGLFRNVGHGSVRECVGIRILRARLLELVNQFFLLIFVDVDLIVILNGSVLLKMVLEDL